MAEYNADGERIIPPLAVWIAPVLSDDELEEIAQAHVNDESGCRSGPCPGENGQGWCDAAMLLVSLRDARIALRASRAREATLEQERDTLAWKLGETVKLNEQLRECWRLSEQERIALKAALAAAPTPPAAPQEGE